MSKAKIFGAVALGVVLIAVLINRFSNDAPAEKFICEEVIVEEELVDEEITILEEVAPVPQQQPKTLTPISDDALLPPDVDRMVQLFQPYPPLLSIVETVAYTGRVPWLTGRAAYLGDYASHYQTSKHFISRSLHGMGNYLSDVVSKGDRFNVLRMDKDIEFHLILDLSRLKMWVYYFDKDEDQKVLLKSYPVCAGRLDAHSRSGSRTPCGTFSLGNEIAVYKPGVTATYKNSPREMISIFGVRWIPLGREIGGCTGSCKGLGLHGIPWRHNSQTNEFEECRDCIGRYESNGCIRLHTEDIEELFAVIISRPSYIHIVRDFTEAKLPGKGKS